MFTGIVEELGIVKNIERHNNLLRLGIAVPFTGSVKIGDSISVNGVCLTISHLGDTLQPDNYFSVAGCPQNVIFFDVIQQTLQTTNLPYLKLNDRVNIEQALKSGDKMGGHIVTGHIDTVGVIRRKDKEVFEISFDRKFFNRIVEKGSVAMDGISLTIAKANTDSFVVSVIPYTLGATTLRFKKQGDSVNVEFDYLGKYAHNVGANGRSPLHSSITEEFLREHGFLS